MTQQQTFAWQRCVPQLRATASPTPGLGFADLCFVTRTTDFTTEQVRQAQIDALIRLIPFTNLVSLLNAVFVATSLYGAVSTLSLGLWLGAMAVLGLVRIVAARRRRSHAHTVKPINLRAVLHGVLLSASLWAVPPLLWIDGVGANEQLIIAVVVTGMLSGASITLSTVPPAAFLFVAILSFAMFYAEIGLGLPFLACTALPMA